MQLEAISSSFHLRQGRRDWPHLITTSFQIIAQSSEVPPGPPLLQNKQYQFPQSLPIRYFLWPFITFVAHLWTQSSTSMSFLKWVAQNWTQHSMCCLTSGEYRGAVTSPVLLVTLTLIQSRMKLAFFITWEHTGSCSADCQPTPLGPFLWASFQPLWWCSFLTNFKGNKILNLNLSSCSLFCAWLFCLPIVEALSAKPVTKVNGQQNPLSL